MQAGTDAGRPLPQQQIIAAEDVVAVYRLEEDGDASGCGVVETETEAPEGIEEEEAMAFDASRAVFRAFTFEDGHEVVIREVQYHMLGYGHTVWEAAIALGAWLRQPRQARLLRDKRVLELGCGCALPGLAAAQCGAAACYRCVPTTQSPAWENNCAADVSPRTPRRWGGDLDRPGT